MAELISMTYEQARAEHFKALKDEAKRKMNYWATRVRHSRPSALNDPAHIKASEYGAEYSYYNDALEALENQPKWISVEERLPQDGVRVLAISPKGFHVLQRNGAEWCIETRGYTGIAFYHVTHWMPLPEAPKEEA